MEIRTGSSDSNSSRQESSCFDRVQRRSTESQYGRKKGSDVKRKSSRKNSSAQHEWLQPQTTRWKKSGVLTGHGNEDTTGRTSSSQEKQRKELKPLHRRANKIRQQECQSKRVTDPEVCRKFWFLFKLSANLSLYRGQDVCEKAEEL
ncbi:hypothetical protein TNCV_531231 [Trichonephila clavipes]|nr:hypothetical protein TNCV_531231 [Trichonephila clavipes]